MARARCQKKVKPRAPFAAMILITGVLVVLAAPSGSFPSGPPNSAFADGCNCHNPAPTKAVTGYISGLPDHYDAGEKYDLLVGLIGGPAASKDPTKNRGGFLLGATAGKFEVPSGSDKVQVSSESIGGLGTPETPITLVTQARQTEKGALTLNRSWSLEWTAPDPAVGDVFFVLYVNSVNGNADGKGGGNTGDEWNTNTFGSRGEGGFKTDPAVTAYSDAAVLMGSMGIILTILFTILGYVLIARGSGRADGPAPRG